MTIENKIDELIEAIATLTVNITLLTEGVTNRKKVVVAKSVPVEVITPTLTLVESSASDCPYSDSKGLMVFVMNKYKELGPIKGAKIQGLFDSIGAANVSDIKPDQYADFYAGMMALGRD